MSTRSILDIIVACKDQQPATEEELRLTVVALAGVNSMPSQSELRAELAAVRAEIAQHRTRLKVLTAREDELLGLIEPKLIPCPGCGGYGTIRLRLVIGAPTVRAECPECGGTKTIKVIP